MQQRLSLRFNITLPIQLAARVTAERKARGLKLSAIVQQALWDWLAKQPQLEAKAEPTNLQEFETAQAARILETED